MKRAFRLMVVSVLAMVAGSGLASDAIPEGARGPWLVGLPSVPVAEAAEFDWQTIFPNGNLEDAPSSPNSPPTNFTFSSGLSSWSVDGDGEVTVGTGGASGDYAHFDTTEGYASIEGAIRFR